MLTAYKSFLVSCCLFLLLLLVPVNVFAADLQESYIRPDRTAAGQAPGRILVVATTAETVTEDAVRVTVGDAWSMNPTASSYTVSTTQLPSDVTAWPGIDTATQVSGQAVTFPSDDLVAGTRYGFYITGGVATNPLAGSSGAYVWNVATEVLSSISSDADSMVSVIGNDQVTITGAVEALAYYFSADIASLASKSTFNQNETIEYEIAYGSELQEATTLTIQAGWSLGTVSGSSVADTEILSYVVSSAGTAYGGTAPVIDLQARTITWTITSFPADTTNQKVRFKLRTSSSYTGSSPVSFTVSSRVVQPAVTSDSVVMQTYQYQTSSSTSPSPTPSPSSTPVISAPTPSPTVSLLACNQACSTNTQCSTGYCHQPVGLCRNSAYPTSSACRGPTASGTPSTEEETFQRLFFESIVLRTISSTSATALVQTSLPAELTVVYGTAASSLQAEVALTGAAAQQEVTFTSLTPNTHYFFRVTARNALGEEIQSDIFTFKTASVTFTGSLDITAAQAVGQNLPLFSDAYQPAIQRAATLPVGLPYEVFFTINSPETITDVYYFLRFSGTYTQVSKSKLFESQTGIYSGRVTAPVIPGLYEGFVQVQDASGALVEFPVFKLFISPSLQVLNAETSQPVEHARLHFYRFNGATKLYQLINEHTFLPQNPMYSDTQGFVTVVLPDGEYKFVVDALGYESQEVLFSVSAADQVEYPTVYLRSTTVSFFDWISFQYQTLQDVFATVQNEFQDRIQSARFRSLVEITSLGVFTILTIASLVARTRMTPLQLLQYLRIHIQQLLAQKSGQYLFQATVYDAGSIYPVVGAVIILFERKSKRESMQLYSNAQGLVYTQLEEPVEYLVSAPGYVPQEGVVTPDENGQAVLQIKLEAQSTLPEKVERELHVVATNILGFFFEILVVSSVIFEVFFMQHLGVARVLPFLVLSLLNVVIWFTYVSSSQRLYLR